MLEEVLPIPLDVLLWSILLAGAIGCTLFCEIRALRRFWSHDRILKAANSRYDLDEVQDEDESKLLHLTGYLHVDDNAPIIDPDLNVIVSGCVRLKRVVAMYQWREVKVGKSSNPRYVAEWSTEPIDSSRFSTAEGRMLHQNPQTWPLQSRIFTAQRLRFGYNRSLLRTHQTSRFLDWFIPRPLGLPELTYLSDYARDRVVYDGQGSLFWREEETETAVSEMEDLNLKMNHQQQQQQQPEEEGKGKETQPAPAAPAAPPSHSSLLVLHSMNNPSSVATTSTADSMFGHHHHHHRHHYHHGSDDEPQIGDLRISYEHVPAGEATIVAAQRGDRLVPWPVCHGEEEDDEDGYGEFCREALLPTSASIATTATATATATATSHLSAENDKEEEEEKEVGGGGHIPSSSSSSSIIVCDEQTRLLAATATTTTLSSSSSSSSYGSRDQTSSLITSQQQQQQQQDKMKKMNQQKKKKPASDRVLVIEEGVWELEDLLDHAEAEAEAHKHLSRHGGGARKSSTTWSRISCALVAMAASLGVGFSLCGSAGLHPSLAGITFSAGGLGLWLLFASLLWWKNRWTAALAGTLMGLVCLIPSLLCWIESRWTTTFASNK